MLRMLDYWKAFTWCRKTPKGHSMTFCHRTWFCNNIDVMKTLIEGLFWWIEFITLMLLSSSCYCGHSLLYTMELDVWMRDCNSTCYTLVSFLICRRAGRVNQTNLVLYVIFLDSPMSRYLSWLCAAVSRSSQNRLLCLWDFIIYSIHSFSVHHVVMLWNVHWLMWTIPILNSSWPLKIVFIVVH